MSAELVESETEWAALHGEWDDLVANSTFPSIFLTFDYLFTAFRAFHAGDSQPFLIVLRSSDNDLIGFAPFRRSRRKYRGFTLRVIEYVVTWEIDKPYIIARNGLEDHCWEEIFKVLHSNPTKWDLLELIELPDYLEGVRKLPVLFRVPFYRCVVTRGPECPYIDLTMTWDEFLSRRGSFKKNLKKLNKLSDGYDIFTYDTPDTIASGIDRYLKLEESSWKNGKQGLSKNSLHLTFYREVLQALSLKKRVAIRVLMTGNDLMAGIISCEFEDTVYIHHVVYNQKFAHLSPGTMFMGLVIKEYMKAGTFKTADLLCGFTQYYEPWACRIVGTSGVQVYRLSVKICLFLGLRWLKDRASHLCKAVA
jgi:Acetyltransferase (GNAT) domain